MKRTLLFSASLLGLLAAGACAKDKKPPNDQPSAPAAQEPPAPAAKEMAPAPPPAAQPPMTEMGAGDKKQAPPGAGVEPAAVSHDGHRHEAKDPYYCPMDPEESGKDKDATCPVCKMQLVPRK